MTIAGNKRKDYQRLPKLRGNLSYACHISTYSLPYLHKPLDLWSRQHTTYLEKQKDVGINNKRNSYNIITHVVIASM